MTQGSKRATVREWAWVAAIVALGILLRMAFLHEPFERDEGFYATIGQEILRGGIPYRDATDIKPPLIYYLYAGAIGLFGATTEAIRVFTALYASVSVLCVFLLARLAAGPRAGLLAASAFAVFSSAPLIQGSSSNTEVFLTLPLLLNAYWYLRWDASGRQSHLALSGLAGAAAMLIKTVALAQYALLLALLLWQHRRRMGQALAAAGAYLAPPALTAVAVVAFFAAHGALNDFLYWNVHVFAKYAKDDISAGLPVTHTLRLAGHELLFLAGFALPASAWCLARGSRPQRILAGVLVAAILAVCLPGKFFPHYFILLVAPACILFGIGVERLLLGESAWRYGALAAGVIFLGVFLKTDMPLYVSYPPEKVTTLKYGGPRFAEADRVGKYIGARTNGGDYVFQWGFEPEVYFVSGGRPPSRYLANILVRLTDRPAEEGLAMLEEVMARKPKYIATFPDHPVSWERTFAQFLEQNYVPEQRIGSAWVWRRL